MRRRLAWAGMLLWLPIVALAGGASERRLLQTPLANAPGRQLTAITVRYAPGASSPAHRHPGAAFVYVLEGRIYSALAGERPRIYRAGESWFEPPGAHHRVSANASDREPARLLVVFVAAPGTPLSVPEARPPQAAAVAGGAAQPSSAASAGGRRGWSSPVVSAVPSRITAQPTSMRAVTGSWSSSAPHSTPNAGIR
jgi:quercetin dioxygenase-like cupin family protein